MGICYLQHRIISGTYNNTRILSKSNKAKYGQFSCISGSANKIGYIGFILLYMYIILLTMAMTVDLGTQSPAVFQSINQRLLLPQGQNMLFSLQKYLGHFFVIIISLILKMKTAKRFLNDFGIISWGRLTKMKKSIPAKVCFVTSYWMLVANLVLTFFCHSSLLNIGFVVAMYCVIWKRTLFGQQYLNKYGTLSWQKLTNTKMTLIAKIGACVGYWLAFINLMLIVICQPSIVNPGPATFISGAYQNVRGFVPFSGLGDDVLPLDTTKLLEFQSYIFDKKPGIVILNETWLTDDHMDNEIFPCDSYKVFRQDRSIKSHPPDPNNPRKFRKKGGGVLIAVKANLDIQSKKVGVSCNAEIISTEIKCGNDIFCITTCYRVGTLGMGNFYEVEKHLRSISNTKKYKRHLFVGDLNLSHIDWAENTSSSEIEQKYIDLFNDLGMQQIVEEPTHEQGNLLDVVYVSVTNFIKNLHILSKNEICSSDHFGITFELSGKVKPKISKRKIFNYKRADWESINRELNAIPWDAHLNNSDPHYGWWYFKNTLFGILHRHIPTMTITNKEQPPWFDSEAFQLCRKKERLRSKYKRSGSASDYSEYSKCRKEFKCLISEKMKANIYDEDDPALVSKKFWSHLKTTSKSTRIPESVSYGRRFRNNPKDQTEIFNEYFSDQFSELSEYNIDIDFCRDNIDNVIDFNLHRIRSLLKKVKPKKAPGPDGIHGIVLKRCAFGLAYPLSKLYKTSYNTGIIPNEWKLSCVVPVHKKGSKSSVENYRPISLTCLVMKIFEKLIRDELYTKCLDKLHNNQHGFLPSKSCTTQMLVFSEQLAFSLNSNLRTDVIYFDFAKAFDSVSHDLILQKLKNKFSIDGVLLKFILNYLKDREQYVGIGGEKSGTRKVTSGVPQGSILGPLLFTIFINDIVDCVSDGTNIALYADDTKIWRIISGWNDHEILQRDIDALHNWSLSNKMKFHPLKCKALSISRQGDHSFFWDVMPFHTFHYSLNGMILNFADSERDLGVIVTPKMSWNDQCLALYSKSSSRLGLLKRVCHFVTNEKQKRALYLAIVRSQFEHCSIVWRPSTDVMLNKLESIQKRAVKWILNEHNFHYTDVEYRCRLKDLGLLPLRYHFILSDLVIFHKIFYNNYFVKLPSYFRLCNTEDRSRLRSNVVPPNYFDSQRSTLDLSSMRALSSDNLSLKCTVEPRAPAFKNSFFFRAHMLWNFLPITIRQETNQPTFKKLLILHLWDTLMKPD